VSCGISKCHTNIFEFDMITEGLKSWNSVRYDEILAQLIQAGGEI
jgi:hypothetical protein